MSVLEIKNIRKSFDGQEVLRGIDIILEKGDVLAIIGPSGNGKTTLLRCINFLETPDDGSISVNGEKILTERAQPERKRKFAKKDCISEWYFKILIFFLSILRSKMLLFQRSF